MKGQDYAMAKFINPFTDIGFKRIFGQDISKPLLIDFLNCLLEREHKIVDLTFLNKEQVASSAEDRSLIYDVYCKADNDERFIVEMQNKRQDFFIDRSIYYLSSSIARQGERGGEWRYELTPVYLIAFLNFKLAALRPTLRTDAVLTDTATGNALSDKAHLIYLQLPFFDKAADECETDFERWIYILKNMETLQRMPLVFKGAVFKKLSQIADLSSLSREERDKYDYALKKYRDTINVWKTNWEEGRKEGREQGREEGREEGRAEGRAEGEHSKALDFARSMKADGEPVEKIARYTGLTPEEIEEI